MSPILMHGADNNEWIFVTFLDTQVSLAPTHVRLSVGWLVTLSDFQSLVALSEK